jgi:HK97 family phage portal protein
VTNYRGGRSRHGTSDIIHIRSMSTDGVVGLSPVQCARTALGLSSSLTKHAAYFFKNDARPGGILRVDGDLNSDQIRSLQTTWGIGHGRLEDAHKFAVFSGEVDWIPVSLPLDDAQFLEQRQLAATETARVFGLPAWAINAPTSDSLTYKNVTSQAEYLVKFSLAPHLTVVEQAFTNDRELSPQSVYVEFLFDNLLRADAATRSEVYTRALDPITGWMSRAEVRRLENLDPTEDEAPPMRPPAAAIPTNGGVPSE